MSFRLFHNLPIEQSIDIISRLSLRDIVRLWLTGKEMQSVIESDKRLLRRLGVTSFNDFITRTQALPDKELIPQVLDEELLLITAEFLALTPEQRVAKALNEENFQKILQAVSLLNPDITKDEFIVGFESDELLGLL